MMTFMPRSPGVKTLLDKGCDRWNDFPATAGWLQSWQVGKADAMTNLGASRRSVAPLLLLLAAACVPYRGYYKDGAPVARLNGDLTECQVQGVNRVPANTQIRTTPITVTPGRRVCSGDGTSCTYIRGDIIGGETYSYDANAGLRERVVAQCMGARGYRPVEIPLCPSGARESVLAQAPRTLPTLSSATCAVRGNAGWVFAQTAG
jgi:hypothetical protein